MAMVVGVLLPVMLIYNGYQYLVFRGKTTGAGYGEYRGGGIGWRFIINMAVKPWFFPPYQGGAQGGSAKALKSL